MGMPLLFVEEPDCEFAKKYYPGLNAGIAEFMQFNKEFLIENFDVLFMSDLWAREDFHEQYKILENKYNKRLRTVYCPHGFSDKGFYLKDCAKEDITLVYGQNMIDLFRLEKVYERLHSYVLTGNYRYTYYKQNKPFYDKLVQEEIFNKLDKSKPTILYAPTWLDAEESTTFFDVPNMLFSQLPNEYNMIVKLHPRLELDDVAKYYHIVGTFEEKANILFIKDFPVYPLLDASDIFISDLSAIAYDFLPFNRPMFFLNKHRRNSKKDRGLYIYRCGVEVLPEDFGNIYQIIEKNRDAEKFAKIKAETYLYTFGNERPFPEIKQDIVAAFSTDDKYPPR